MVEIIPKCIFCFTKMGCWKVRWHKNVTVEIIQLIDCFCISHRLHFVNYEWPTFSLVWSTKRAYDWCPGAKLLAIFLVWLSSENKLLLFWNGPYLNWCVYGTAQELCTVRTLLRLCTDRFYPYPSRLFFWYWSNVHRYCLKFGGIIRKSKQRNINLSE